MLQKSALKPDPRVQRIQKLLRDAYDRPTRASVPDGRDSGERTV